jgi:hypothetical protein
MLWWLSQILCSRRLAYPFGLLLHVFDPSLTFRSVCGCAFVSDLLFPKQVPIFIIFILIAGVYMFICLLLDMFVLETKKSA